MAGRAIAAFGECEFLFAAGFHSGNFGQIGWELVCGKRFDIELCICRKVLSGNLLLQPEL
jgi:hypothetical protein